MTCDVRRANSSDKKILKARYRVIADGTDITDDCYYADGRRRIVGVYLKDEHGRPYITADGGIAFQALRPRRVRLVKNGKR